MHEPPKKLVARSFSVETFARHHCARRQAFQEMERRGHEKREINRNTQITDKRLGDGWMGAVDQVL